MQLTSKIVCLLLAIWLSAAAVLPLFGMNLIASQAGFVSFDPSEDTLYLFVTRSACFATSVFYLTNYLRRRRPLSSVSPLLVLSIMHFVFGAAYILVFSFFNFALIAFLVLLVGLSIFFYSENEKERSVLFRESW